MINLNEIEIIEAIEKSQHCQRNWDLTKKIPEEHINLFIEAVTKAPSRQNIAYYKTHFITNRDLIESISNYTKGGAGNSWENNTMIVQGEINSQSLANLLIVFEFYQDYSDEEIVKRNAETQAVLNNYNNSFIKQIIHTDRCNSIGIASGYVSLLANMLGYSTGFCICMQAGEISKLLNTHNKILLLLGVGYPNIGIPHNVQHGKDLSHSYNTMYKQKILVNRIY